MQAKIPDGCYVMPPKDRIDMRCKDGFKWPWACRQNQRGESK